MQIIRRNKFYEMVKKQYNFRVVFLYGDDSYLTDLSCKYLIEQKAGANAEINSFDAGGKVGKLALPEVSQALSMASFLTACRVVRLQNCDFLSLKAEILEKWLKLFKSVDNGFLLVIDEFTEKKLSKTAEKHLQKIAETGAVVVNIEKLSDADLAREVNRRVRRYKLTIDTAALLKLLEMCAFSLQDLNNAVDVLALYCQYLNKTNITSEIVKKIVKPVIAVDDFALLDAVAAKDSDKTVKLIKDSLDSGIAPEKLIADLAAHLRKLFILQYSTDKSQAKMFVNSYSDYYVGKLLQQCRSFSKARLASLIEYVYQADLSVKTVGLAPDKAVYALAARIFQ